MIEFRTSNLHSSTDSSKLAIFTSRPPRPCSITLNPTAVVGPEVDPITTENAAAVVVIVILIVVVITLGIVFVIMCRRKGYRLDDIKWGELLPYGLDCGGVSLKEYESKHCIRKTV